MRRQRPIDALLPRTRQGILALTLLHPDRWWYLSDLAKHLRVPPSSLQRELAALSDAGVLRRRRDGNRVYVRANESCPFVPELTGLVAKTVGLVDVLRDALAPLRSQIDWAFVYGSLSRSEERPDSDVDLMVVGAVGLAQLAPALRRAEHRLLRPVNPTVYTLTEIARKLKLGHHFLEGVLAQDRLFVLGRADDLARALGLPARSTPHRDPSGD